MQRPLVVFKTYLVTVFLTFCIAVCSLLLVSKNRWFAVRKNKSLKKQQQQKKRGHRGKHFFITVHIITEKRVKQVLPIWECSEDSYQNKKQISYNDRESIQWASFYLIQSERERESDILNNKHCQTQTMTESCVDTSSTYVFMSNKDNFRPLSEIDCNNEQMSMFRYTAECTQKYWTIKLQNKYLTTEE